MRTVARTAAALPTPDVSRLPPPPYAGGGEGSRLGLAVASMRDHMTNEGWELFAGLEHAGYRLAGHRLPIPETDVRRILAARPSVVVVQDAREWDVARRDFRDPAARFTHVEALASRPDVFTLTVLKDAHQRPEYHRDSAAGMGAHAWITYYDPDIVCRVAPYVRREHLVRTYHTLDAALAPAYSPEGRAGCLLSGAVSGAYPLRRRLFAEASRLPETTVLKHPGYHRRGCATPEFLRTLSRFKVAICTSSVYGYALRKFAEATACGCAVLTDLPSDEVMPEIDGNLVRIDPDTPTADIADTLRGMLDAYDPERQAWFAAKARAWYDFKAAGARLAADIEAARAGYSKSEAWTLRQLTNTDISQAPR